VRPLDDGVRAACDRNGVSIWRFDEAPDPFRSLSIHDGAEEFVLYVPPGRLDEHGELDADDPLLWFLDFPPKYPGHVQYAGDEWGWYSMVFPPQGGIVAVTTADDDVPVISR
jgi:hypothetical protein